MTALLPAFSIDVIAAAGPARAFDFRAAISASGGLA
jgi:hypothetical protein